MAMIPSTLATQSLYLHWPFCPYKCHFCPFVALSGHDQFMEQYHERLKKEICWYAEHSYYGAPIHTLYMGGGTPSTYPSSLLLDMFVTLKKRFCFSSDCEITIEVNPGTVQEDQLVLWKDIGINRLSIGVQSLKDGALKSLNRHQTMKDVLHCLSIVQKKFENISIDLILGLPDVSAEEWKSFLREIVLWPLTHISLYFLTIHENTPLYFKVQTNRVHLPADDMVIDLYHWTVDLLHTYGMKRYELSNFARTGFESRHNTVYWERKPFKGFGLGAWSFEHNRRSQNEKHLLSYCAKIENNQDITLFSEYLTDDQIRLEKLMLGLRRQKGISFESLLEGLSQNKKLLLQQKITELKENNFLHCNDNMFTLTPKGLLVENEVITQLYV